MFTKSIIGEGGNLDSYVGSLLRCLKPTSTPSLGLKTPNLYTRLILKQINIKPIGT